MTIWAMQEAHLAFRHALCNKSDVEAYHNGIGRGYSLIRSVFSSLLGSFLLQNGFSEYLLCVGWMDVALLFFDFPFSFHFLTFICYFLVGAWWSSRRALTYSAFACLLLLFFVG